MAEAHKIGTITGRLGSAIGIKLCSSIKEKRIVDMPQFTQERYIKQKITSPFEIWRFNNQKKSISINKILRIEVMADAIIHWTDDNWLSSNTIHTKDTDLGTYVADIVLKNEYSGEIKFTFFWKVGNHWENKDFMVKINAQ